ncbi:hypothetical protein JCM11641_003998 [Rhodosporidiobolus odoratus]
MPFGQVVIGPPGSGKTTYVWGMQQFFAALQRPILLVNLDPASPSPPYPHSISISSLISLQDAMTAHKLGPNGAMLYCLEYLEANLDWLEEELEKAIDALQASGGVGAEEETEVDEVTGGKKERRTWRREDMYVVFDTPGQVELSTDHGSLKRITQHLQKKLAFRLAAVHLMDASHILDASKYVAILLLALRTMLQLELPHINVLSKVDLLGQSGDLPFNLDFYTEVQDLSYLLPLLERDQRTQRFGELNRVVCDLVEEFGLVSFETLAVEDKDSMLRLVQVIDQALGYVTPSLASLSSAEDPHTHPHPDHAHDHIHQHHHTHAPHPSFAQSQPLSNLVHAGTVQEKWVDHREDWEEFEKERWEREGEWAAGKASEVSRKAAMEGVVEEEE